MMGGCARPEITAEFLKQCMPELMDPRPVGDPGGSKRTFRAEWRGQTVAAQVIEEFQPERLEREIAALRRVDSDYVPHLLAVAELDYDGRPLPVLICEYVDGLTLDAQVKSGVRYDARSLKNLAVDISTGLLAIHSCDLVHRDLKPANVIIRASSSSPVIVDLGVAKHLDRTTITRAQPGTPGWAAPEQLLNERVDRRADLFSLGVLLHYAACGVHSFAPGDLNENIVSALPEIAIRSSHGAEWERLLTWLMARQAYSRPRQIQVVLTCLEDL
jgi:serine/threonine protein kinase